MIQVKSSTIKAIGYDEKTGTMIIRFKGDRLYHYATVPIELYNNFMVSQSKGKFFHKNIRGKFESPKDNPDSQTENESTCQKSTQE